MDSEVIEYLIQILEMAKKIIDKPGPYFVDTNIYLHTTDNVDDKERKKDYVKIGVPGKPVTLTHIVSAFKRIQKKKIGDCTYIYEGLKKKSPSTIYTMQWRAENKVILQNLV